MKNRHLITALLTVVLAVNVTATPASAGPIGDWWDDVVEGWDRLWDDCNDLGTGVNGCDDKDDDRTDDQEDLEDPKDKDDVLGDTPLNEIIIEPEEGEDETDAGDKKSKKRRG